VFAVVLELPAAPTPWRGGSTGEVPGSTRKYPEVPGSTQKYLTARHIWLSKQKKWHRLNFLSLKIEIKKIFSLLFDERRVEAKEPKV
jgi:hypothetical protein